MLWSNAAPIKYMTIVAQETVYTGAKIKCAKYSICTKIIQIELLEPQKKEQKHTHTSRISMLPIWLASPNDESFMLLGGGGGMGDE